MSKSQSYFVNINRYNLNIPSESLQIIADGLGTAVEYLTGITK